MNIARYILDSAKPDILQEYLATSLFTHLADNKCFFIFILEVIIT